LAIFDTVRLRPVVGKQIRGRRSGLSDPGHHHDQCECEAAADEAPLDDPMGVF
jgi:hypothetical protein